MSDNEIAELQRQQAEIARRLTETMGAESQPNLHSPNIDSPQLHAHRETLVRKRIHQTSTLLPYCHRALDNEFEKYFREFALAHHFNSVDAIRLDALHFANWLAAKARPIPWLASCIRLDRTRIEIQHSTRWGVKILRLDYALHHWKLDQSQPNKKATVWIFLNSGSKLRVWLWP
jgi:hypothetical protein